MRGGQKVFILFAPPALLPLWRQHKPFLIFALGLLLTHTIAYTWRVPPEPFDWYHVPSRLMMAVLSAIGFGFGVRWLLHRARVGYSAGLLLGAAALIGVTLAAFILDRPHAQGTLDFANHQEADRTNAGVWVAQNTPLEARVYTGFGNISFGSHRYVYDYSFLNRPWESGDMVARYNPEVLVLCPSNTAVPPAEYSPRPGYKVVKIFDKTYRAGKDFYAVVMFREDLPGP